MSNTAPRRDGKGTDFGNWLREQDELDSHTAHLTCTDIDYLWRDYRSNNAMILEEKTFCAKVPAAQSQNLNYLRWLGKGRPGFRGVYVVQFENTTPDNGRMWVEGREVVSVDEFREWLRFSSYVGELPF